MNRRMLVTLIMTSLSAAPLGLPASQAATLPALTVYRNPGCSCCEAWAQIMSEAGFAVTVVEDEALAARRTNLGITEDLAGCHTAVAEGLILEGHVPPADVLRFLRERPADAIGLAVPGMPTGSPGMGPEGSGPAYEVLLLRKNGAPETYARH